MKTKITSNLLKHIEKHLVDELIAKSKHREEVSVRYREAADLIDEIYLMAQDWCGDCAPKADEAQKSLLRLKLHLMNHWLKRELNGREA